MKSKLYLTLVYLASSFGTTCFAQWLNITPNSGNVTCLYSGSDGLYAGLNKPLHYLYRSTDSGKTWTELPVTPSAITSIGEMDGILLVNDFTSNRVYYSKDRGNTWQYGTVSGASQIYSIAAMEHVIFSATDIGIFKSQDSGKNWVLCENSGYYKELVVSEKILVAGGNSGIKISRDLGKSWVNTHGTGTFQLFVNGPVIFAGNNDASLGIVVSTDTAKTWTWYHQGLPASAPKGFGSIGDSNYCVMQDEVFRSTDTGKTWLSMGKVGFFYNASDIEGHHGQLFVSYNSADIQGGIYRWAGGSRWKHTGIPMAKPDLMYTVGDTVNYYSKNAVWSKDRGKNWQNGGSGPSVPYGFKYLNQTPYLFGNTGCFSSSDGGINYVSKLNVLTYDVEQLGNNFFYTSSTSTWRKTPSGSPAPVSLLNGKYLGKMLVHKGRIFFAGRSVNDDSYYSEDTGKTFKLFNDSLFKSIISFVKTGNLLFALNFEKGNINSVILSTDDGFTWVRKNKGIPAFFYASDLILWKGMLVLAGSKGLYVSKDSGESWQEANQGLPGSPISISKICADDSFLYIHSDVYGIFRGTFSYSPANHNQTIQKRQPVLFPNPGKGDFTLQGVSSAASMQLFNMTGSLVPCQVIRKQSDWVLKTEPLPAGIYFLHIHEYPNMQTITVMIE